MAKSNNLEPTKSNYKMHVTPEKKTLVYGKKDYKIIIGGWAIVILGLILMIGGAMPDEDTWDPGLIYSFRRITLAPILIIAGLAVQIYAIFRRDKV